MLKVLLQFGKVIGMLVVLMVINPHRTLLAVTVILAALGSWFAGKLEDGCQWLADKAEYGREHWWLFGGKLNKKLDVEVQELHKLTALVEKKLKEKDDV